MQGGLYWSLTSIFLFKRNISPTESWRREGICHSWRRPDVIPSVMYNCHGDRYISVTCRHRWLDGGYARVALASRESFWLMPRKISNKDEFKAFPYNLLVDLLRATSFFFLLLLIILIISSQQFLCTERPQILVLEAQMLRFRISHSWVCSEYV